MRIESDSEMSQFTEFLLAFIHKKLILDIMSRHQMSIRNYFEDEAGNASDELFDSSDDEPSDDIDEYEKDSFIADDDEVLSKDVPDDNVSDGEPPTKKRRTNRVKKAGIHKDPDQDKEPGHPTYPLNNFSLTISKCKGDVPLTLLEVIHNWIVNHCEKGGVATEVGKRAFNFHLQALLSIKWPRTKQYVTKLSKHLKSLLPKSAGYKLLALFSKKKFLNFFSSDFFQKNFILFYFIYFLLAGYITKDQGQPHYHIRVHNITAQELTNGRRDHVALLRSFDDNKKIFLT